MTLAPRLPVLAAGPGFGAIVDVNGVAFARIEPGHADARALAAELAERANVHPSLVARCDALELEGKRLRDALGRALKRAAEAEAALGGRDALDRLLERAR